MPLSEMAYFCVIENALCEFQCVFHALRKCMCVMYMSVSFVFKFTSLMDNNGIDSIFELLKPFSQWTTQTHTKQCILLHVNKSRRKNQLQSSWNKKKILLQFWNGQNKTKQNEKKGKKQCTRSCYTCFVHNKYTVLYK